MYSTQLLKKINKLVNKPADYWRRSGLGLSVIATDSAGLVTCGLIRGRYYFERTITGYTLIF